LKNCRIIQVDLKDIEETVVEDKKQKPKFRKVNLQRRHGEELIEFWDLSNPDYFPVLATKEPGSTRFIRNHDQISYTDFYRILQSEERFTSEKELEENSERLVQSYATYTNSKGRCLEQVTEAGIDKLSTNYVPWSTWKPNSSANYTIKVLHNTSINHIICTIGFTTVEYFGETAVTTIKKG
jgi:hypothetical protein